MVVNCYHQKSNIVNLKISVLHILLLNSHFLYILENIYTVKITIIIA